MSTHTRTHALFDLLQGWCAACLPVFLTVRCKNRAFNVSLIQLVQLILQCDELNHGFHIRVCEFISIIFFLI